MLLFDLRNWNIVSYCDGHGLSMSHLDHFEDESRCFAVRNVSVDVATCLRLRPCARDVGNDMVLRVEFLLRSRLSRVTSRCSGPISFSRPG